MYNNLNKKTIDKLNKKQEESIINEVKKEPIISVNRDMNSLKIEYKDNINFLLKVTELLDTYNFTNIRRSRRDGNCFYQCVLFRIFEFKIYNENSDIYLENLALLIDKITNIKDYLIQCGLSQSVFIVYYESFMNIFNKISSITELETVMSSEHDVKEMILLMRLITSYTIQNNKEKYSFYFSDYIEYNNFFIKEVESMYSEVDNIQIQAFSSYFNNLMLKIFYLDNSKESLQVIELNKNINIFEINLLYRPGHYDIIY